MGIFPNKDNNSNIFDFITNLQNEISTLKCLNDAYELDSKQKQNIISGLKVKNWFLQKPYYTFSHFKRRILNC